MNVIERCVRIVFDDDRWTRREAEGLVGCDEDTCQVREDDPTSLEEALRAIEHWKYHGYLSGCSHGQ